MAVHPVPAYIVGLVMLLVFGYALADPADLAAARR